MSTAHEPAHNHDHDHDWRTRSRHSTSEGTVTYQQCPCGRWQVRLGPGPVLATTPSVRPMSS